LRNRHGWRGELRAIGDVLRDQLFFMKRVGFDSFALRADRNIEEAVASLSDFTDFVPGVGRPRVARVPPHRSSPASAVMSVHVESALALLREAAGLPPAAFSTSFGAETWWCWI